MWEPLKVIFITYVLAFKAVQEVNSIMITSSVTCHIILITACITHGEHGAFANKCHTVALRQKLGRCRFWPSN